MFSNHFIEKEPSYLILLKTFIYISASLLLLHGSILPAGQGGAVIGCGLGVFLAYPLFYHRIRKISLLILLLILTVLAWSIIFGLNAIPGFFRLFGISFSLSLTQFFTFFLFLFGISLILRNLVLRYPFLALLEISMVSSVVVYRLIGHRDRNISEPRALSDWAWSRGKDPITLLVLFGVFTLCLGALLLLEKQRFKKLLVSLLFLVLLGTVTFWMIKKDPIEPPPQRTPLGLTGNSTDSEGGKEKEEKGKDQKEGSGGSSSQELEEMPYSNNYPKGTPFPVAVVLFHEDYHPPEGYYYFRQTAFSYFNGTRLIRAIRENIDLDLVENYPTKVIEFSSEKKIENISVQVPTTVAMIVNHRQPFGLLNPIHFEPKENPNPNYFRLAYFVNSIASTVSFEKLIDKKAGNSKWSDSVRKHYLSYPNDSRYFDLAHRLVARLPPKLRSSPMAQSLILRLWLEKNTVYTRKSEHADAKDPTASFLFGDRRGYCVHLAHSMAFLLRSLGIPSRVAAGYAVPDGRKGNGSNLLVQNQDAHAWAEFYLEGVGWTVMDVAPERSEEEGPSEVNSNLQRAMGELAREDPTAGNSPNPKPEKSERKIRYDYLLLFILLLLLLVLYGVKIWRRVVSKFSSSQIYRLSYRATLDRLAEVGLKRAFGETREGFALRIRPRISLFQKMTEAHLREAFKSKTLISVAEWREIEKKIKDEIKNEFSFWRRLLGLLNPISWMGVK